jgi:hypothetical protein
MGSASDLSAQSGGWGTRASSRKFAYRAALREQNLSRDPIDEELGASEHRNYGSRAETNSGQRKLLH